MSKSYEKIKIDGYCVPRLLPHVYCTFYSDFEVKCGVVDRNDNKI
jgi:hypothetical protein